MADFIGTAGDDILNGTSGPDHMQGLGGDDTYYVDHGGDMVVEAVGGGSDTVIANISYTLGAGQEVELLRTYGSASTGAVDLTGNEFANIIAGNAAANVIDGRGGADNMWGYAGNDTYFIDNSADRVTEGVGGGSDTVIVSASFALAAGQEIELLRTWGSATTDAVDLTGNALTNTIAGNAAANRIDGKGGADWLWGYGGADTFAFTTALGGGNVDRISDFETGVDKIVLDNVVFGGLFAGALGADAFVVAGVAQDAEDRIIYNSATGALLFDADGAGGAAAVQFATLGAGLSLGAGDFTVNNAYGDQQYALARAIAEAAGEIELPAYEGSLTDLVYLRDYVRSAAADFYGVDPSTFDTATILSTSLLRDFLHRASLQSGENPLYTDLLESGEATVQFDKDVAAIFRYPSTGFCGLFADQMFDVYRAFGYETTLVNLINGEVGVYDTGSAYDESHSTTEVYVNDLGKSILQDATINGLIVDNGEFLSSYEARSALLSSDPHFDTFGVYYYVYFGSSNDLVLPEWAEDSLFDSVGGLQLDWRNSFGDALRYGTSYMFPPLWTSAHTSTPAAGTVFADGQAALSYIADLKDEGESWYSTAARLREAGYYASGFRLLGQDGSIASSWLTVRQADGDYLSIEFGTGQLLAGSFDQLLIEAVGKGAVQNPGIDLSSFLSPIIVLGHDGKLGPDWIADNFPIEIEGGPGADVLKGTEWLDQMHGFGGDDTYYVDHGGDVVEEAVGGGSDTVITDASYTLGSGQEVERLTTWGSITTQAVDLTGNAFANIIVGNDGVNRIDGKGGADIMWGYAGSDTYYVDHSADSVTEAVGGGSDTVIVSASFALAAGQEIELLRTYGSATTDAVDLTGNGFANTIAGNAAANRIDGKGGADWLWGYGGADAFAFTTALGGGNVGRILDFQTALDKIALDDAIFTGLGLGPLAAGAFRTGSAAADADDRIIYNSATGALFFDADGLNGAAAVQFATLSPGLGLAASDFTVI